MLNSQADAIVKGDWNSLRALFIPTERAVERKATDDRHPSRREDRGGAQAGPAAVTVEEPGNANPLRVIAPEPRMNSTNLFDASAGFGGYRESGFGREGGREGVYEYLKPKAWAKRKPRPAAKPLPAIRDLRSGYWLPR